MAHLNGIIADISDAHVIELDISELPEIAEIASIIATPTLIRYWPLPKVTVIGDLSDMSRVRDLLTSDMDESGEIVYVEDFRRLVKQEKILDACNPVGTDGEKDFAQLNAVLNLRQLAQDAREVNLNQQQTELRRREQRLSEREKFAARRERVTTDSEEQVSAKEGAS